MPLRKARLSALEARKNQLWLSRLRAEGLDIGADIEEEDGTLQITQGRDIGIVCDYSKGSNVAYAIPVRIVAHARTIVEDYSFESSWGDYIELPPYLVERNGHYELGTLGYLTREVLNDRLGDPFNMNCGSIIQGVVLAYGCVPIPEELAGRVVPVRFTLVDTWARVPWRDKNGSRSIQTKELEISVGGTFGCSARRSEHAQTLIKQGSKLSVLPRSEGQLLTAPGCASLASMNLTSNGGPRDN